MREVVAEQGVKGTMAENVAADQVASLHNFSGQ